MNKIKALIDSLKEFPSNMWGLESCIKISWKDIESVEKNIKYTFPPDFRFFLLHYNWITIPYDEIYTITWRKEDDILEHYNSTHNLIILDPLPDYMVPFSSNWYWDYYCFNTNDNKVYFWQYWCTEKDYNPSFDNDSFTYWLEKSIKDSKEIWN